MVSATVTPIISVIIEFMRLTERFIYLDFPDGLARNSKEGCLVLCR